MTNNSIKLEEERLKEINKIEEYDMIHERHRGFPQIFENRKHKKIIDLSAGVGVVANNIKNNYNAEIICNEISPKCLSILKENGHKTVSFNLDSDKTFPIKDKTFDNVISLATIEHIMNIDHFVKEIKRILKDDGYLYISAPNYSSILYLLPVILTGRTFHNPLNEKTKYEFYAHIRYFTYKTLLEYISSFGFVIDTVYLLLPKESSRFIDLRSRSWIKAIIFKITMSIIYRLFSPRWASEPILCFRKGKSNKKIKTKKRIL